MTQEQTPTKFDEGRVEENVGRVEAASSFDRTFKYALVAYAVVEFIAVALVVYFKLKR